MTRLPRTLGLILAALHVVLIVAAATWILWAFPHDGESPMLWIGVALLDYPVAFIVRPIYDLMSHWPDVSFLPPIANNWEAFLAPLLLYSVVGTLWWFCIGWLLGKVWKLIFHIRGGGSQVI